MGQSQKHWTDVRSVFRCVRGWITFWLVTYSIFMIVAAPNKEKK